jgi:adhesin transport system outer membrane protein
MRKILMISALLCAALNAQDLKQTLKEVIETNPDIAERAKNYNMTKEDLKAAKGAYLPKLDLSIATGNEKTAINGNISDSVNKTVNLTTYQTSLSLTQNLFNGFQTTYYVKEQDARKFAAAYSYVEKVNTTSLATVTAYAELLRNKELLDTSKENVDITNEIFTKVQKLYDSGLTTLSEVNKIKSSLALAKANYVVQENSYNEAFYTLHRYVGRFLDPKELQKPVVNSVLPANVDEAAQMALHNNPSIKAALYNIKLAQNTYKEKKAPFYPSIDLEVSESQNKNTGGIEQNTDNFKAIAYLKYNLFNGFSDSAGLQKSVSQIHQEIETKNSTQRQVVQNLNQSWSSFEKLQEQLKHLEEYKDYSVKTLALYSKEYDLGRRSLLDLLSAQNDLIGSRSQIINSSYNMLESKFKILDAMGVLVDTVLGEGETNYYHTVDLHADNSGMKDNLLISYDRDHDLIPDGNDLCTNSLPESLKNDFGCKEESTEIAQIERYSPFTFSGDSSKLTSDGKEKLDALLKQMNSYELDKLKLTILGNVDDDDLGQNEKIKLSKERAEVVAQKFISLGVPQNNITVLAEGDKAPLVSDETSKGIDLNNRVDVIVKKLKVKGN